MDYAHANFQSFPLSHHKFTRLRSQYCSVNSMDLTWAFFLPSALSFYSTVSASCVIHLGTLGLALITLVHAGSDGRDGHGGHGALGRTSACRNSNLFERKTKLLT